MVSMIVHFAWITTLAAIFCFGSLWLSIINFQALDNTFVSNTRGYLLDTSHCYLQGTVLSGQWLSGTLEISFYGISVADSGILINQTIPPLGVCLDAYNECCRHWVGKELYVQVSYTNDTYYVIDLSDDTVQNRGEILGAAIITLLVSLCVAIGYVGLVVSCFCPKRKQYETVN